MFSFGLHTCWPFPLGPRNRLSFLFWPCGWCETPHVVRQHCVSTSICHLHSHPFCWNKYTDTPNTIFYHCWRMLFSNFITSGSNYNTTQSLAPHCRQRYHDNSAPTQTFARETFRNQMRTRTHVETGNTSPTKRPIIIPNPNGPKKHRRLAPVWWLSCLWQCNCTLPLTTPHIHDFSNKKFLKAQSGIDYYHIHTGPKDILNTEIAVLFSLYESLRMPFVLWSGPSAS